MELTSWWWAKNITAVEKSRIFKLKADPFAIIINIFIETLVIFVILAISKILHLCPLNPQANIRDFSIKK